MKIKFSMKVKRILLLLAVLCFGFSGKAQTIPNVSGNWTRNDGQLVQIVQNKGNLTITLDNVAFQHTALMTYQSNNVFKGTMTRKNVSNGCITKLSWQLEVSDTDKMRLLEGGLDRNCDVQPTHHAEFALKRELPKISGSWTRSDNFKVEIVQTGSNLIVTLNTSVYRHTVNMTYKGNNIFQGTMNRKNITNNCITNLNWKLEIYDTDKMRLWENGLDNHCDLQSSHRAEFTLKKDAPNISGEWTRSDGHKMTISQHYNSMNAAGVRISSGQVELTYEGNNIFKGTMTRTNNNNCVTYLSWKLEVYDTDKIRLWEGGLDRNCDIQPSYRAEFTLKKSIPNLAYCGWTRNDNQVVSFQQNGAKAVGELNPSVVMHTIHLTYQGNGMFQGTMTRKNTNNGCITYLYWKVQVFNDVNDEMQVWEYGMDRNCDVPPNHYAEYMLHMCIP